MRRPLLLLAAVALTAVLAGCAVFGVCDETAPRSATVPIRGATTVRIVAEAGHLEVSGNNGATEVAVTGTACAMNADDLEQMQFVTSSESSQIVIEARTEPRHSRFDVTVEVPDSFRVEIKDGSGEIDVRDVAGVRVDDGSGDIGTSGVAGEVVVVEDGSGDIVGDFVVDDDGSGDVHHSGIGGRVDIP